MMESLLRPLIVTASALAVTILVGWITDRLLQRIGAQHPAAPLWPLLRRCRTPLQLTVITTLLLAAESTARVSPVYRGFIQHVLLLVTIASAAWLTTRVLAAVIEPSVSRYAATSRDYARVRRVRTQVAMI